MKKLCWLVIFSILVLELFYHLVVKEHFPILRENKSMVESGSTGVDNWRYKQGTISPRPAIHQPLTLKNDHESMLKVTVAEDSSQNNDSYEALRQMYPELYEKIPKDFIEGNKNPCWLDDSSKKLRCLPYFYQIGIQKCGTTDLWDKIVQHPQVQSVPKEPHWWAWRRNGFTATPIHAAEVKRIRAMTNKGDDSSIEWYLNWFGTFAVPHLERDHQLVFGDGSISTGVEPLSGNWTSIFPGATEQPYNLAQLIHSIQPNAKIIVILREPVSRSYSGFLYNGGKSALQFQRHAKESIQYVQRCMENHSIRYCAYKHEKPCQVIIRGLYHVFLRDWIEAYGREKIHFIRLDDWIGDAAEEYKTLINFLELDPLSDDKIHSIIMTKVMNSQQGMKHRVGDIPEPSRKMLQDFYRPHNHQLAQLLNDSKYLWDYP